MAKRVERKKEKAKCKLCGKEFEYVRNWYHVRVFCSPRCSIKALAKDLTKDK